MGISIDCLIPFYNEQPRISAVIEAVQRVEGIGRIICVDDGSTDGGAKFVQERFPHVQVVRLQENQGKSDAVRAGLPFVQADYVMLIDADLSGLDDKELACACAVLMRYPELGMIILRRMHTKRHERILHGDVLFSGERVLRTKDLAAALAQSGLKGYQLEIALNEYFLQRGIEARWMPSSARNSYKYEKRQRLAGLLQSIIMTVQVIAYVGTRRFVRQGMTFCRQRVPEEWMKL